jgi:hypothetical protein
MSPVSEATIEAVRTVEEQASRDYFFPVFRQRADIDCLFETAKRLIQRFPTLADAELAVSNERSRRVIELKDTNGDVILSAMSYTGVTWEIRLHKDYK